MLTYFSEYAKKCVCFMVVEEKWEPYEKWMGLEKRKCRFGLAVSRQLTNVLKWKAQPSLPTFKSQKLVLPNNKLVNTLPISTTD